MNANRSDIRLYVATGQCTIFNSANHTHVHIYIKAPYFSSFLFPASSIIGLALGLIVGLGTVLVLFFIAFSPFRCILKDRKLAPGQHCLGGLAVQFSDCTARVTGSTPMRAIIFLNVFFPVFFKVFCKLGLGLVLALRLVKYFLKKIDFVHA